LRKKILPIILGVTAIALLLLGLSLLKPNKAPTPEKSNDLSEQLVKACDLLDIEAVKSALGPEIEPADDGDDASSSSNDIALSRCVFVQKLANGITPTSQKRASLMVRTPRSDTGKQANKDVFTGNNKPANVESIEGFGDAAFWNPEYGQLNILKNEIWYTVEVGTAVPSEHKADEAKLLAKAIL
jgi:hypothetical protein